MAATTSKFDTWQYQCCAQPHPPLSRCCGLSGSPPASHNHHHLLLFLHYLLLHCHHHHHPTASTTTTTTTTTGDAVGEYRSSPYYASNDISLAVAQAALATHTGGFRYDPLLYLMTMSLRQLRATLAAIGVCAAGTRSLERALVTYEFAGDYFMPLAIPALAVGPSGCHLAVGSFDCSVTGACVRACGDACVYVCACGGG